MILTNFFIRKKILTTTANLAKKRLQVIISKKNTNNKLKYYNLINLQNDLIQVIQQHIHEAKNISIQFKQQDQNTSYLKCVIFFSEKDI